MLRVSRHQFDSLDADVRCVLQLFYRAHIIGALVFVVFGIVHWNGTLDVLLVGLVVYGIDVAYRWFQTRHSVTLRLSQSSGGRIISIAIPLQV